MGSIEHIRSEILRLLQTHEPHKSDSKSLNHLMREWKDKEHELLYVLCLKFKEKYIKMTPKSLKQNYLIGPKIGRGGFSVVRKCKRKSDGKIFALKSIKKSKYISAKYNDLPLLENEVNTMRMLSHPNIIQLHDVFENDAKICLVLDYCDGGALFDSIRDHGAFEESEAKILFYHLCKALQYLHSHDIAHRDLKIEDMLFPTAQRRLSEIQIVDFGLSAHVGDGLSTEAVGTPHYVAPEVLKKEPYDTQCDMWALGVILYIILIGHQPFFDEHDDVRKMYEKIKKGKYEPLESLEWNKISSPAKDLVRKLLNPDPRKRWTASMALRHPWVKPLD